MIIDTVVGSCERHRE